jgi:hypothetical protein
MFKNKVFLLATLLAVILSIGSFSFGQKTVHVKIYTKKDGTVVAAHDRSAPNSKSSSSNSKSSSSSTSTAPKYPTYSYPSYPGIGTSSTSTSRARCITCERDSNGRIRRSSTAKHDFERMNPCPSTGRTSGGCPGYVIDHVRPLATGGADSPSNMQWQTIEAAKAKDRIERRP